MSLENTSGHTFRAHGTPQAEKKISKLLEERGSPEPGVPLVIIGVHGSRVAGAEAVSIACLEGRVGTQGHWYTTAVVVGYRVLCGGGGGRWVTSSRLAGRICVMCACDKKGN